MKKISLVFALITFFLLSVVSHSHMDEKHTEKNASEAKEPGGEMREHHGEMEEHHEKMDVLHESMEELGGHADKIFHSIINSEFSDLSYSAQAVKKVAEGLAGTRPHKNLENIDRYNSLVKELIRKSIDFKRAVDENIPVKIADNFGRLLNVCVECHINFRN